MKNRTNPRLVALVLGAASAASADVITVDDDGAQLPTADYSSIDLALQNASDGDEIVVYPGIYTGMQYVGDLRVTLRSSDPLDPVVVASTILRPAFESPAILMTRFGAVGSEIRGFTFDGAFTSAGAISSTGSAPLTVSDCVLEQFDTEAALVDTSGTGDVVERCAFRDNTAQQILFVFGGTVSDCVFESNTTERHAVAAFGDSTVDRCVFRRSLGEQASINDSTIDGCVFQHNTSQSGSGVVYVGSGGTVLNSSFLGNRTSGGSIDSDGGAVLLGWNGIVRNCVFVGNEARSGREAYGGAIHVAFWASNARIEQCTIVANTARSTQNQPNKAAGGGIFVHASADPVKVKNTIVRGNFVESNGVLDGSSSVQFEVGLGFDGQLTRVSSPGSGALRFVRDPDDGGDGWIDLTSTPDLDEAANNDFGDLRLLASSIDVDAGNTDEVAEVLTTDYDGNDRVRGTDVDRGAYESAFHDVLFVDEGASGLGTGFTWDDALTSFSAAAGAPTAGEIRIARGTYTVAPAGEQLKSHTWLRGGYAPGGGGRNPATNVVVLTGDLNGDDQPDGVNRADNATHVLWSEDTSDITIDGVTVSGANSGGFSGGVRLTNVIGATVNDVIIEDNDANRGGGIGIRGCEAVVSNSIIRNNRSSVLNGGMRVDGGSLLTITDSEISGNASGGEGGGAGFYNGSMVYMSNSVVADNVATTDAGGIEVSRGSDSDPAFADIFNTLITGNFAGASAGGVRFAQDVGGVIDQCLITDNQTSGGHAVLTRDSATLLIRQSTIADNIAALTTAGLGQTGTSTLDAINTIVYGNAAIDATSSLEAQVSGAVTLDYSLIEGWDGTLAGIGSIAGDPLFESPASGDYRIGAGSPAIDAGDTNTLVDTEDLDGNPRVLDDTGVADTGIGGPPVIDMGAYEFQGTTVIPNCPGDLTTTGAAPGSALEGVPDSVTDFADLLYYINVWDADLGAPSPNPASIADMTTTGGAAPGLPDGNVDLSDLLFFVNQWSVGLSGCP